MLKEIRFIDTMKVYNMCKDDKYYTMGTTEEYSNLLDNLCGGIYSHKTVSLNDIEVIAKDIYSHSDIEEFEKKYSGNWCNFEEGMIEYIAHKIVNDCCYSCIEYIGD